MGWRVATRESQFCVGEMQMNTQGMGLGRVAVLPKVAFLVAVSCALLVHPARSELLASRPQAQGQKAPETQGLQTG